MADLQIFPVWKQYDTEKKKWKKVPAVPKGTDWHTYQAKPGELDHAKNVGIVIPARVVVIDLDTYKGVTTEAVDEALGCELDWELAELQKTVTGGRHYGFALPDGVTIRQGDNLLDVKGFDTRTTGNGWICTGEGYEDLTLIGVTETMKPDNLPMLPSSAIEKLAHGQVARSGGDANEMSDLEDVVGSQPLDGLTVEGMRSYLSRVDEAYLNAYQSWVNIGMACHHQTQGGKDGVRLWAEASRRSDFYDPQEIKDKWRSFGRRGGDNQITFAYVIRLAGGKDAISGDLLDKLMDKAASVNDADGYEALKKEVQAVDRTMLGDDLRGMIAAKLADQYGKEVGITRSEIKKALTPPKKKAVSSGEDSDRKPPEWLEGWVYVEMTCEFAHTVLGYAIKREAFNAKYDRMPECMMAETTAANLALNHYGIETVVDKMFWPGAQTLFEHEGKKMLNGYRVQGIEPCGLIDDDGQGVIDLFLQHLHFVVDGERERQILLDWMAYVYQNPGSRINWALLLQGSQGVGKTYFINVLQYLMGSNVTNLDPQAINGRFTGWAHGSVVIGVEEIRVAGENRFQALDRMKPFITNDTVQIEEKGRDHRTVPNFSSYMLLTNHLDAIPLTAGDRRYAVIFSRIQSEPQLYRELGGEKGAEAYFDRLFSESKRRADALARWLHDYKISDAFSPKGRAPDTDARQQMMDVSVSGERTEIEDAVAALECDVINDSVIDLTWLNEQAKLEGYVLPKTRAITAILLEIGYRQVPSRRIKVDGKHHYIWYNPENYDAASAKQSVRAFHGG